MGDDLRYILKDGWVSDARVARHNVEVVFLIHFSDSRLMNRQIGALKAIRKV